MKKWHWLPKVGEFVRFIPKLRNEFNVLVTRPTAGEKFMLGNVASGALFVVLGQLNIEARIAVKTAEDMLYGQHPPLTTVAEFSFWCLGPDGVCVIDRLSIEPTRYLR